MRILVSIDPGKSTGVAIGAYSDTDPYKLIEAFQFEGGVEGFIANVTSHSDWFNEGGAFSYIHFGEGILDGRTVYTRNQEWVGCICDGKECNDETGDEGPNCWKYVETAKTDIIAEKFTARGSANQFAYRTEALEPLRVEGAMLALGIDPEWVYPQAMYFMVPPGSKANRKTMMHRWLKEHDLYVAPKDVGCKDADDARSAVAHAIAWLRKKKHLPTLKHYFGGSDE